MEDVLKRLLETEVKAEALVTDAEAKHAEIVRKARADVKAADAAFEQEVPTIRDSQVRQAEERAAQTIAEITRRYEERQRALDGVAEERATQARDAAIAVFLDTERR